MTKYRYQEPCGFTYQYQRGRKWVVDTCGAPSTHAMIMLGGKERCMCLEHTELVLWELLEVRVLPVNPDPLC